MILHTVLPLEAVMEIQTETKTSCRKIAEGFVEGTDSPEGFVIGRLVCTDPKVYLDPRFAPGQLLGGGAKEIK